MIKLGLSVDDDAETLGDNANARLDEAPKMEEGLLLVEATKGTHSLNDQAWVGVTMKVWVMTPREVREVATKMKVSRGGKSLASSQQFW